MKKSLSLLLALALVVSLFSTLVSAADKTTQEKYDELFAQGIFEGHADGEAGLDENMTRAQAAVIITKVLQLDTSSAPATASFTDVPASHWGYAYIEAAVASGYINGNGDGTFTPSNDVTIEQLAIILGLAASDVLEQDIPATGVVSGKTSPWATNYVAFAIQLGLIPTTTDYTVPATRAQLVDAIYEAQAKLVNLAIVSYEVVDRQTVKFLFNDGTSVEVELEEKLKANTETEITFEHQDEEFTATVIWAVNQGIVSFEAIGAKKLEVVLAEEIDQDNVEITLKKGAATTSIKEIKYDGDTAVIETNVNLTEGTYTVTVKFVEEDVELTEDVTVENQKIAAVEVVGENAPIDRGTNGDEKVSAWIKVTNQYGEDITSSQSGQLTLTASKGNATYANGKVEISLPSGSKYILNEQISLSVLHSSGAFATKVLTVSGPARVGSVEVVELKHATTEDKEPTAGDKAADYSVVIEATDQYGNKISNAAYIAEDVLVTSSNPYVATVKYDSNGRAEFKATNNEVTLALASGVSGSDALNQGKSTISFLPAITGNRTNFELEVGQKVVLDTLTINAPDYLVAGEKTELPFTAVDQFGNEITKASVLNNSNTGIAGGNGLQIAGVSNAAKITFEQDPVTNKPVLTLDLENVDVTNSTPIYINGFTANQKQIQASLTVQPNAKPQAIANADKTAKAIALGGKTEIKAGDLKVVDQYGRTKSLSDFTGKGYTVDVTSSNSGSVVLSASKLNAATTQIDLTAGVKGTSEIKLSLKSNESQPKELDVYSFSVQAVDKSSIASYEVGQVGTLYANDNGTHAKEVKVTGKLSNGTVVALPTAHGDYYDVVDATYNVQYDPATKKVQAKKAAVTGTNAEKTYQLVVITYTDNASQTHTQDVVVSNVAPAATKLEVQASDANNVKKVNDGYVTIAKANLTSLGSASALANVAVKVTDQYGEVIANVISKATASEFSGDNKTIGGVAVGESFTLTVVTDNGKTFSFKVGVK